VGRSHALVDPCETIIATFFREPGCRPDERFVTYAAEEVSMRWLAWTMLMAIAVGAGALA